MSTVEVCPSPELIHLFDLKGKAVIVADILRASSCIVTGLSHGISSITPFSDLESCRAMQQQGYITAGERNGAKAAGFDLGNSPFEYMNEALKGKKVAMTTTNGTQALERASTADEILVGAFLNLSTIEKYLVSQPRPVIILCAGWKGMFSLEDTLFAGALIDRLGEFYDINDDAGLASLNLYNQASYNLFEFLKDSSHFKRLAGLNIIKDIRFCLKPDEYETLPVVENGEIIVKDQS